MSIAKLRVEKHDPRDELESIEVKVMVKRLSDGSTFQIPPEDVEVSPLKERFHVGVSVEDFRVNSLETGIYDLEVILFTGLESKKMYIKDFESGYMRFEVLKDYEHKPIRININDRKAEVR